MVALAAGFVLALGAAGSASAASISYVGSDGNVWLTSPDGGVNHRVTSDATATTKYRSPTQADNGTIAAFPGSNVPFAYLLRPTDGAQLAVWSLPKTGGLSFAPYTGGQISPSGTVLAYDWWYSDLFPPSHEPRVSFVASPATPNPCSLACSDGYFGPRWIPGTLYAGFVSESLDEIDVQDASGVHPWLGLGGPGELIDSFDVSSTGRTLVETHDDGAQLSRFYLVQNNGTPPAGSLAELCHTDNFAPVGALPRWSPDGSMIAWQGSGGIFVSPAPSPQGGGCAIQPRLIAPGGTEPSWGPANVASASSVPSCHPAKKKKGKKSATAAKKKKHKGGCKHKKKGKKRK